MDSGDWHGWNRTVRNKYTVRMVGDWGCGFIIIIV